MRKRERAAASPLRGLLLATVGLLGVNAASAQLPALTPEPAQAVVSPYAGVPAHWSKSAARQLVDAIEGAKAEGLSPADYQLGQLRSAIEDGDGANLDAVAEHAALSLAHDFYFGRVSDRDGFGWHVERSGVDLAGQLHQAVADGKVTKFMHRLLPDGARYAALRDALADAGDSMTRDRIRANMERWRWMPRGMGESYLYVNVPTYRLQVVDGGMTRASYTVVVGAKDTPTPWLATEAPSLVVHPWWNVPASIAKSSGLRPGRGGFQYTAGSGGGSFRQPPGPRNALGQLKINLTNDQAIYLHDTPAKWAFGKDERALSHGCVRVKDIAGLAASLMEDQSDRLDDAMAGKATQTLTLPKRWPVYIVYFTMDQNEDGSLVSYGDPYARDAALIQRLDGPKLQLASN